MSNQFRRTWQQHTVGQILFTVGLDPVGEELSIERHRRLADLARRLVDLFSAYRLPATWAAASPSQSAVTSAVMRSEVKHELALLGDAGWVGPAISRSQVSRELARRVGLARSFGLGISSLVPRAESVREHADVFVKQGISAVARMEAQETKGTQRATPRALHYGLWELPVTHRLPLRSSWFFGGRGLLRQMRGGAQDGTTFHLSVDAAAVEREGARPEAVIGRIIRGVAELRDRGLVRVETLSTAAARLAAVPAVAPQRSILRRAA
jgi:hypothetical protein